MLSRINTLITQQFSTHPVYQRHELYADKYMLMTDSEKNEYAQRYGSRLNDVRNCSPATCLKCDPNQYYKYYWDPNWGWCEDDYIHDKSTCTCAFKQKNRSMNGRCTQCKLPFNFVYGA